MARGRDPIDYRAFDFHGNATATVFAHLAALSEEVFPQVRACACCWCA